MQQEEIIFNNGDDYFTEVLHCISQAKSLIQFETYIFDRDNIGNKILEALAAAVRRGVLVQLLLDGVGSSSWSFSDAVKWREQGVELKFFHSLPWQRRRIGVFQLLSLKKLTIGLFKLKHRNHRKTCIIDGSITFIGSMNVSDRHLPSIFGVQAWRDTAAKIQSPEANRYATSFEQAWNFSQHHYGKRWLRISQQKKWAHLKIVRHVRNSQQRVWITNPYFIPDFKLTRTLCSVARRGVDVKILLPSRSDVFGIKFAMEGLYALLLAFGIEIYEYSPAMLHAKILIIDEWVSMGSSNLDPRSIFYNLEIDATLHNPNSIRILQNQFVQDLLLSKRIRFADWKKRSWLSRGLEKFFLFFRGSL